MLKVTAKRLSRQGRKSPRSCPSFDSIAEASLATMGGDDIASYVVATTAKLSLFHHDRLAYDKSP